MPTMSTYKHGMKHFVTLHDFKQVMLGRRVDAMQANARKVARKIHRVVLNQIEAGASYSLATHEVYLGTLARQYQVAKCQVPYAIALVKELLANN